MYTDVESSAACNGKEGASSLVESDCSLLAQAQAPEDDGSNVPECLEEHPAFEVRCMMNPPMPPVHMPMIVPYQLETKAGWQRRCMGTVGFFTHSSTL